MIWDNISLQHARSDEALGDARSFRRAAFTRWTDIDATHEWDRWYAREFSRASAD